MKKSHGNQYRPLCKHCDIELNVLVLEFMHFDNVNVMIGKYRKKLF